MGSKGGEGSHVGRWAERENPPLHSIFGDGVNLTNLLRSLAVRHPNDRKITVHIQDTHFLTSFAAKPAEGLRNPDHEGGSDQAIPRVPWIDLLNLLFCSSTAIGRSSR